MTRPKQCPLAERRDGRLWFKVLGPDELPEGRVMPVTCERHTVCVTHFEGEFAALDNRCPHQGGPLGEGSIENGFLRCPWHGWDFHPITGKPPGGYDDGVDTYPVEVRTDGVYVGFPEPTPHERTVSDLMVDTLTRWGVRHVWGMVGHSNLGFADAMRRAEEDGRLRYYGIRHEGAASFAASAYGKLTGRPAACFSIAGPGATNLLTGLWDANVDRAPVLALTGQVDTQVLGPGAFQEVDLVAAFGKVAQWSQTVLPGSRHAELVNLALKSAILNRGVSHLILPDEVQTLPEPEGAEPGGPEGRVTPREIAPPETAFDEALDALRKAERPVIIVGHGARFSMDAVVALAERLRCPVVTTFKAKGQISDRHPLGCGVLGRSGTPVASWFMNEADLLLVFGASFSNHTGITPKKFTIQVDFDPMMLGKFHAVDVPVWGEIGVTAGRLLEALNAGATAAQDQRGEIAERWRIWRAEKASRLEDDRGEGISAIRVFDALGRQVPGNAIMPVDVGNNTYSFGRYFECTEQRVLMSGYLGSIGFGLPAALGAWAATQEEDGPFFGRSVVSISGDGGFAQYMGELTTAVRYGMGITHVLLNNAELGKISKEQRAAHFDVWQTELVNPNFAAFADNCGALGIRVERAGMLDEAIAEALAHDGPALVEVMTDPLLV
ncbi:MAG: thiamine pyrophosphate-binding protein [Gemmatimonadetes bacterium]|nr:MAG: thiamine pyrophosphate-binding protein [Gemmatimonadota bacterium]